MPPQFPGQPHGQSAHQRAMRQQNQMRQVQQQRRQMGGAWMAAQQASRAAIDDRLPGDRTDYGSSHRLGVFGRVVRFLLALFFFAVAAVAGMMAAGTYAEEDSGAALVMGAVAVIALLLMLRVRRWGRS